MAYAAAWFWAFLFTELVEVPIYGFGLRVSVPAAFGASAITHPLLWFLLFPYLPLPYAGLLVAGEAFAVTVEALYFSVLFHRPRALRWSLAANAASLAAGLVSRWCFGWP
jgi:hypothetical protein